MKTILTILALIIVTSINAQTNSIPKEYYGMYSATFGDEGSGNEVNYVLFMDSTSNEQNVYKEIFHGSGNKATYYTVKSFNQQNGEMILNSKLTIFFDAESSETTILTDTTGKAKLIFKKNKSIFKSFIIKEFYQLYLLRFSTCMYMYVPVSNFKECNCGVH